MLSLDKQDATLTVASCIEKMAECAGTDFHATFQQAEKHYKRVIILSGMQAWVGHHAPVKALHQYKKRVGALPKVFTFDLAGYGSLTFPETNVYRLAGFSDKTLETLSLLDQDHQALLRQIANVVI